jgi:hypothetical protein
MTPNILQICAVVIAVSFTSVVAVGSFAVVCGIISVLLGRDADSIDTQKTPNNWIYFFNFKVNLFDPVV